MVASERSVLTFKSSAHPSASKVATVLVAALSSLKPPASHGVLMYSAIRPQLQFLVSAAALQAELHPSGMH